MSPLALAWRGLTRQPARAILAIVGIAAVGALLFDMLLLSRGLVLSMERILESGEFDIRVASSDALPGMGPKIEGRDALLASLTALPDVERTVALSFGTAVIDDPRSGRRTQISLSANEPRDFGFWTLIDGSTLGETGEDGRRPLLVNRVLMERAGVETGDTLFISGDREGHLGREPLAFRIDGIVDMPFDSRDEASAVTTMGSYFEVLGADDPDEADLLLVTSAPSAGTLAAMAAIEELEPDLHVFSTAQLVARFQATEFSYFRQVAFVLSSITLVFAFLLVSTLLTVSVNQRFGEIAALRALGFSRQRVVLDLLCESGLMVGTGGLLALPLGFGLARWLDEILRAIPGLPEKLHFFVYEPRALTLYCTLMALTGVLAAAYPVILAARLPIARKLRNEVVS